MFPQSMTAAETNPIMCVSFQICSNGWSEKVNKCLQRRNKRMWFLINLKEEQPGDLVNPSFICCLRPLVCLLHNVVFKCVCAQVGDNTALIPSEWNVNRFNRGAENAWRFPAFCQFCCSLSFTAPAHHQHHHQILLFFLLLSHLFEASFAASWLWRSQKAEAIISFVQLQQA